MAFLLFSDISVSIIFDIRKVHVKFSNVFIKVSIDYKKTYWCRIIFNYSTIIRMYNVRILSVYFVKWIDGELLKSLYNEFGGI